MENTDLQKATLATLEELSKSDATYVTYRTRGRLPDGAIAMRAEREFVVAPDGSMRNLP